MVLLKLVERIRPFFVADLPTARHFRLISIMCSLSWVRVLLNKSTLIYAPLESGTGPPKNRRSRSAKLIKEVKMRIFRRGDKKEESPDYIEARFQTAVDLIKDLDRSEFKRFVDGLTLTWQGYDKIRQVQSREEKEMEQINQAEHKLEMIEGVGE